MAIELADTLVNARADLITAARDAGASGGHIRIYNGTRPSKGGTVTTLLGELTFVLDGDCGLAGADLNFNDVNVVITLPINISSYVVTDGNF